MAFLFKVFSGSERLREKQKSAAVVNETFKAELKGIQTKLEVENYELQMLLEMIYDSSFPESQKFLKDPSLDRLYGHKETISSLLFGLAAQGIPVAPLILAHFQKYGCEAIGDTLMKLLELVRPLLASKDAPEFTSDDILDAIDNQWHSSVRSSPAFGSLRGSRAQSPLNSPRNSLSLLSPRFSVSSPQSPFSIDRVFGSSPGPLSPHGFVSPRNSRSFSIPPTVAKQDAGISHDRFIATPPRRSLSSQYPSDMGSLGERLQTLAEHDDETNSGVGRSMRKHNVDSAESSSKDGANSWTHKADEADAPSRIEPESSSILRQGDVNDHTAVENVNDFSSLSLNGRTGENNKVLTINIPRSALSYEFNELDRLERAGRAQVVDDRGRIIGDVRVKKANETTVGFLPPGPRSDSFSSRLGSDDFRPDGSRPVASREHFDKSVQDLNAGAPPQVGENKDISWDKLGSDVSSPESLSSRNLGSQIPEETASFPTPIARSHVDDLVRRVPESITKELNSADDLPTLEEGIKEDNLHPSKDRVDDIKTAVLATSHIAKEMQLQAASAEHDECKEVQEAKVSEPPYSTSADSSGQSLDEEIGAAVIDSSSTKEVKDKTVETPALDTSVDGYEHGVMDFVTLHSDHESDEGDSRLVIHAASLEGECSGEGLPSEDLVQNESIKSSHGRGEEVIDTEVFTVSSEKICPVRVLDIQMVHSDNESSPSSKVYSYESRNSPIEENRESDSGSIEYRSQTTQDEVEQPVITDSSQAKNEELLPQVEAKELELPVVANPDSRVINDVDGESHGLKLVSEGGDEYEASGIIHESAERDDETGSDGANRGAEDTVEYEVLPIADEEAAVTLSPVTELDNQMVHSDNETFPSGTVHSDESRNSSVEECRGNDSVVIGVSPVKEYCSQTTQDEVELPVTTDSSQAKNEDHMPQVEAEKLELPVVANPDSRVISDVDGESYGLKLVGEGGEQHEASRALHDSIERVNETGFDGVNRGIEDMVEHGVSSDTDEEAAVLLSPVRVLDSQVVHSNNGISPRSKTHSDDYRSTDSGFIEVSSSEEYRSETTKDEVEQPVISDKAENEDHVPHVEAEKHDSLVVTHAASLTGEYSREGSPFEDLVENEIITSSPVKEKEVIDTEVITGGRNEIYPVRELDIQMVHSGNESSSSTKVHGDDSSNSSVENNRVSDSGFVEASASEEYRSQATQDEVEQPVISDSSKVENEDHLPRLEAEKHGMPTSVNPDSRVTSDVGGELYGLKPPSGGSDEHEGSGTTHDSVERVNEMGADRVNRGIKDTVEYRVSPNAEEEAAVILSPVRVLDIQMVHSDDEISPRTKVHSDDSRNSFTEESRESDADSIEVSPFKGYRSQTTQDEVEQPVISDSPKAEKEVDVPHVEAKKLEMPSFVNIGSRAISDVDVESYGLKLVSEGGDEFEASGTTHQSVERVNEMAFDRVNRGIEDAIEDGVSPNVDEEAVVILSPVKVVDIQTVHIDNESSPSSKAYSDDFRNSSIEENRSSDSGINEVSSPKEYHSQTTEDEVEQPVRNDSYKAENEDPVPHEMPIFADPDSRVIADIDGESYGPKLVSEGSDQHEASGGVHDSIERGNEMGSGIEDTLQHGVSLNADEEEAVYVAHDKDDGVLNGQDLADNNSKKDQIGAIVPARKYQERCEPLVAGKNTQLGNGARSSKTAEAEKSALGELSVPLEGVAIVEPGTSSEQEQSRLLAAEDFEYKDNERPAECILTAMDITADRTKVLLKDSNGEKDGVIDCIEGYDNEDKKFSSASSVEEDRSLRSVDDEEFSYSSRARPDDDDVAEKSGTQAEVEAQRPHATGSTAGVGTDIVPQVSFSDYSDVDGSDESSSTSTSSSSSSSSSSDPDEDIFSSASSSSSDKGGSSSSSDDESDDASSLPFVRTRGAMPSISSTSLVEDVNLEIEDQHSLSRSSSGMDRVESIHEAERAGVDEDINGPKLEGAELHSPSYNSVTFDLTKLSTDNNEDTSSCFSLQSQDDDIPVVTNEQVVNRKSSSCDWLDMISVNYLMGSGSNSPSTSAARMSTVSSGISLHSFSFQRDQEDETADYTTPDADVAPDSAGSQSSPTSYLDAGLSANHLLDSEWAEKSSVENTEGAGLTDFVTLHSDHESDEGDSLGVTHAASLTGEYSRKGSPSKDLVQDEMITSSPVGEKEVIDTEVITGGRNETYSLKELDTQMVHSDNESSPSTKVHSDNSRNSFIEENRGSKSGFIEVSPSEYRSQPTEDEVEQSVISDTSKVENEDHLPHVEAKKHDMAIFANPDSRVISDIDGESYGPKLVSEGGDQHEGSGSAHDSTERVNEMGSDRVNLGVEDTADHGVSPDVDKEDAVLAHDKEGGALNSQDLADTISEEDQIGVIEHVSKSSESEVMPIYTGENDAQENAIPGTSSSNLLSTGRRDGGHSPVDGVDEVVDSECQDQVSKLAASNVVQDEEKVGVSGNEMGESDPDTDVNMEVSTLSVASSEPAVFESQNSEDSGRENVLHSPEHAHSLLSDGKEVETTGANYPTPSNIHDGIMPSPVEYGHDEHSGDEKQSKGNEAEVSSSSKEVEGQALMHNLDEVDSKLMEMPLHDIVEKNSALTISESLRSREHETSSFIEHVDKDPEASSEVLKLSGGDSSSSGGFPFEDTNVSSNRNPPYQDLHPVNGSFQKFLPESVSSEKEERLPVAMALHEAASRNTPLKDEEVRGTQTAQVLDTEEAHECDIGNKRKMPPFGKEVDTVVNTTKPAITGKTEPIRRASHKGMENEKIDRDAGSVDGPLETMNILDSRGNMVRAVTLPVTMARPRSEICPTPVAKISSIITDGHNANGVDTHRNHQYHDEKTGWNPQEHADYVETTSLMRPKGGVGVPELHNIRDSIICTPAYPKRWEPYQLKKQRFSWQRKRCKILQTLCCSLCSKCSTL